MAITSLFPTQGLQNFIDESINQLTASSSLAAGTLGGSGVFRSSVVGRAAITDISQNLKVSLGIERTMVQSIYQIQNEFGSNGEIVWGVINDDRNLARFIGSWSVNLNSVGAYISASTNLTDALEITFFGTGLNVLSILNQQFFYTYSVDGATPVSTNTVASPNAVLAGRSYAPNQIFNVVSGLTLGLHTIKIINNSISSAINVSGFEIINESLTLRTNPGSAFAAGKRLYLSAQDSQSATSGFTNTFGVAGAKGGHVLQYLALDGSIKKDIQYVDVTAQYLTSADHTNEEVVRTYNWREFGAGRADDFSTLAGAQSARAFTLDDGTTTLSGSAPSTTQPNGTDSLRPNTAAGNFITFTFVGTGFDMETIYEQSGGINVAITVDGVAIGNLPSPVVGLVRQVQKIVSGLPYGTHVVKITNTTIVAANLDVNKFIVYQPKKPTLPSGAVELADYNVMATYVANASATDSALATGVLRKHSTREFVYVGTWSPSLNPPVFSGGWLVISTAAAGNTIQYTFFGTGFDFRMDGPTSANLTVTIDGSTNLAAFSTTTYGGTATFTGSTGIIAISAGSNAMGAIVSGLTLGLHTVKITTNNAIQIDALSFDIITPIHSVKSNSVADLQNTLPVGSCAISDNRLNSPISSALTSKKAWAQTIGITLNPTTTSTTFVPMPDMSVTIKTNGQPLEIAYTATCYQSAGGSAMFCQVYVDGSPVGVARIAANTAGFESTLSDNFIVPVSAGTHKVDVYWKASSNTVTAENNERTLKVREI